MSLNKFTSTQTGLDLKIIRKDIEDIRKEILILEKKINDRIIILENVIK